MALYKLVKLYSHGLVESLGTCGCSYIVKTWVKEVFKPGGSFSPDFERVVELI